MKLGRTMTLLWLASLTLFGLVGAMVLTTPATLDGVSGLVIRFFLGYCGIIVVAQVLVAMNAVRQLLDGCSAQKPQSCRVLLR